MQVSSVIVISANVDVGPAGSGTTGEDAGKDKD
jgi:hypothetical protein